MARCRWLILLALVLAGAAPARAQVVSYSNPYDVGAISFTRGFGLGYRRHHLRVAGFIGGSYTVGGIVAPALWGPALYSGWGPHGVALNRVNVIVPFPVIVSAPRRHREPDDFDTTGIDLDEYDPVTMKRRQDNRAEPERLAPPPPLPVVPLPPPAKRGFKEEPMEKDLSLLELGKRAFAQKEYGVAAQRFRLAIEADRKDATVYFLLAQAQFSLAKYRDAVSSIQSGMDPKADWPRTGFALRTLYAGNDIEFLGQLMRLEEVVDRNPEDRFLIFLLAYQCWFDGKKAKAVILFKKAKKLSRNPRYIDPFLRAAR